MNNEKLRMLLLLSIYRDSNNNIYNLKNCGFSFSEIASEYSDLINEKLVVPDNKLFVLSENGINELNHLKTKLEKSGNFVILPYNKYKKERTNIFDIFIE